jgi:hypothetical protein
MKNASTLDLKKRGTYLILGQPGAGKTSLALNFPKPFVLDCDDNIASAIKFTGITNFLYATTSVDDNGVSIPPASRYARLTRELNEAATSPLVETIILDSLTSLIEIIISECKRLGGISEDAIMRIQDWGTFANVLRGLIVKLKGANKNIIVIGHVEVEQDEADKIFKSFIAIPGKNRFTIAGLFSDVWLMRTDIDGVGASAKTVRKIRTVPDNKNDYRGLKNTWNLPTEMTVSELVTRIKTTYPS